MELIAIIVLVIFAIVFPTGIKYFIVAPMCGLAMGGFTWAIASMLSFELVTVSSFGKFVLVFTVLAEIVAFCTRK